MKGVERIRSTYLQLLPCPYTSQALNTHARTRDTARFYRAFFCCVVFEMGDASFDLTTPLTQQACTLGDEKQHQWNSIRHKTDGQCGSNRVQGDGQ